MTTSLAVLCSGIAGPDRRTERTLDHEFQREVARARITDPTADEPFVVLHDWRQWQAERWLGLLRWCAAEGMTEQAAAAYDEIRRLLPRHDEAAELARLPRGPRVDGAPRADGAHADGATPGEYDRRRSELRASLAQRAATLAASLFEQGRHWEADHVTRHAAASATGGPSRDVLERLARVMPERREQLRAVVDRARRGVVRRHGGGLGMRYAFSLPPDHDPSERYPIFVMNHGTGYDGAAAVDVAGRFAFRRTCIVVGPTRARPARWGDVDILRTDCERILQIVSTMVVQFGGDPARVFMAGHSWGGAVCYAAIAEYPDHFAGIVHVYGNFYPRGDAFRAAGRPVTLPILVLRAEHDEYNQRWFDPQREAAFAALERHGYSNITLQHVRGAGHSHALRALRQSGPWIRVIAGRELLRGIPHGLRLDQRHRGEGVRVARVTARSNARRAGFQGGDVILTIDGEPVSSPGEVDGFFATTLPDAEVAVEVMRDVGGAPTREKLALRDRAAR